MGSVFSRRRDVPLEDDMLEHVITELMHQGNVSCLPDSIERQIYRRLLRKALSDIKVLLANVRIHVIGHELRFILEPLSSSS